MAQLPRISLTSPGRLSGEQVVLGTFQNRDPGLDGLNDADRESVEQIVGAARFEGATGHRLGQLSGDGRRSFEVHGLGPTEAFTTRSLENWIESVLRAANGNGARRLSLLVPDHPVARGADGARRVLCQAALSGYAYDEHRTDESRRSRRPPQLQIVPPTGSESEYRSARTTALAIAEGVAWARDLGNTPPNRATPAWMASRARRLAKEHGASIRVLGPKELRARRMGGILAVSAGSASSPRLVRLEWGDRGPIVALVGKGVTFDSGGISIKPAADMDEMKYDKCGACNVLGTMLAAATADLPVRLRAYVPLAENMPGSRAYRPGDIVRCYNGKTVEIINTDAEGRMILADALSWAAREKPDHILEYSTLTGAAVVALGESAAALFTPSDDLANGLLAAAQESGERLWRLPLWDEYLDEMKGNHADLRNAGGRWGGACSAAAFLSQFVDGHPSWCHIDLAGPAMKKSPKSASGYGVALTIRWLERLARGDDG